MSGVPEQFQPSDLPDARRIIGELRSEIQELRKQRTADIKDIDRVFEENKRVVEHHNELVEKFQDLAAEYDDLKDRHDKMEENIDAEVERRIAEAHGDEWDKQRKERETAERRIDDREVELSAREAILKKRYGSGQPRGRPAEYSRGQILEVRKLHEMGTPKARIGREIGLTRRQVGYIVDHKLPRLQDKGDGQRGHEFTPLFAEFQKELQAWLKDLSGRRRKRHEAVQSAKVKAGVRYLNATGYDRDLRSYLAADFESDTPPRLVLAADQLRAWMKVNDSTSPDGWGR